MINDIPPSEFDNVAIATIYNNNLFKMEGLFHQLPWC